MRILKSKTLVFSTLILNISFSSYSSSTKKSSTSMVVIPCIHEIVVSFCSKPTVIYSENDIPSLSLDLTSDESKPTKVS